MFKLILALSFLCFQSVSAFAEDKSAADFLKAAEAELLREGEAQQRTEWVAQNFITPDTTLLSAAADAKLNELGTRLAKESKKFEGKTTDERRKLSFLLNGLILPSPKDSNRNLEMSRLGSELKSAYGSGKACTAQGKCRDLEALEDVLKKSRNPAELLSAWTGWHAVGKPMKSKFQRIVELGDIGARELQFKDLAEVWKSKYEIPSQDFEKSMERVWTEMKPLYEQLHCYVRSQLNRKYGDAVVPKEGPIPAHLLGNMWAQDWSNIYDLTDMKASKSVNISKLLEKENYHSKKMVKTAENFFTSLGMPKLPATFYERSLFEKPRDREVVCHASAWDIDAKEDVRIKMCIRPNEEDFRTIHHELGHIYYYLAYQHQPYLYATGANDGFHEGLGDTIELSMTRSYLEKIHLLKAGVAASAGPDIDYLFRMALKKVAFLPFGMLVDKWRWQVFSRQTPYSDYNKAWWALRRQYQGVKEPVARASDDFDPGAKYHVSAFVPYSRYFLAHIYQFQFHRALCKAAGQTGPLAECSIYGNLNAGKRLWSMMQLGASKPWPEVLKTLTGESDMDATALRDYFAPLETWLKQKNKGQKCGW